MRTEENTRIIDLTLGELCTYLRAQGFGAAATVTAAPAKEEKKYLHGLAELAEFLGCSRTQAVRIKATGLLRDATSQYGRTIIFDSEKVAEALRAKPRRK